MSNITIRFYIITENKIIRVGVDSDNKRPFPEFSGKTAVMLELFYFKTKPPSLLRSSLALIEFDTDGRWSISSVEEQRAIHKIGQVMNRSPEKVSFIPAPRINKNQKGLLKERIVKDFGIHFWNSLKNNILVYHW
ncbi:MAG: hypothetical protein C4582_08690 [Desulfobacteraceae bacterium]|nr:MAG: hypothetical protein C4582_08690 [Desulfobacteraceae bacterium]